MSRTATATPPPPFFPQRTSTPSMRHSASGASNASAHYQQSHFQRHFKKKSKSHVSSTTAPPLPANSVVPSSPALSAPSPLKKAILPMSASDVLGLQYESSAPDPLSTSRSGSIYSDDASSIVTSAPSMSATSSSTDDSITPSLATPSTTPSSSVYGDHHDLVDIVVNTSTSSLMPPPASPSPRFWSNGFGKMARAVSTGMISFTRRREGESPRFTTAASATAISPLVAPSPNVPSASASPLTPSSLVSPAIVAPSPVALNGSFVLSTPNSAIISPVAFLATPSTPPIGLLSSQPLPPHSLPPAIAHPNNMPPALTPDSPDIDNPVEALRRFEWAEAQRRRVTECARLCSQWPQSGYNLAKWGPNGCPNKYEPQSWANPNHVVKTMQRQAELERQLCSESVTFFACRRDHRASRSDDDLSDPSSDPYDSAETSPSPATSVSLSADDALATVKASEKTAADIRAAMASPLMDGLDSPTSSILSESTKSLAELDRLAQLTTNDRMDVDELAITPTAVTEIRDPLASIPSVPGSHPSALSSPGSLTRTSCGAKRPLKHEADEEEKRRKVDEVMVIDEAVDLGVVMDKRSVRGRGLSASTPNLSSPAQAAAAVGLTDPAVFGHVVKTSDTHPIIISPFIPSPILPTLSQNLVSPPPTGPFSATPLLLASNIDVPSLLLSVGSGRTPSPPPIQEATSATQFPASNATPASPPVIGNLLLSSCPGKRLRMDGPVKGRGPVCRDLATDLRRIKGEGVGCLVCCLDDDELSLLGVPWKTYRALASNIGLDVIRLPMPDGFTPVSLQLFDSQVTLIATRYTLQGTNVLVHCRGGIGRAGLTACAWAIKMGFVQAHPSLLIVEEAANRQAREAALPSPAASPALMSRGCSSPARKRKGGASNGVPASGALPAELEHQIVMSIVERAIAMIRSRRGLKAIESFEQVQFLATYVAWLRENLRANA